MKTQRLRSSQLTDVLRVTLVIVLLALACIALELDYQYSSGTQWVLCKCSGGKRLAHALISVGPELAGIVIGLVIIDYLNERRQDEQLKRLLVLQMGSRHNDVTDIAVRALDARGWLKDGSLRGVDLTEANLEGANLEGAVLLEAKLAGANLEGANLTDARLSGAFLQSANMQGAQLRAAELQESDLTEANLKGAKLANTNLDGAILFHVNFEGAKYLETEQLQRARILDGAIMPDGIKLASPRGRLAFEGPTFVEWHTRHKA